MAATSAHTSRSCSAMGVDTISLNIGGHLYSTARSTIDGNVDSRSFLARLVSDRRARYFVDRDGTHFRYILNYLREKTLALPKDFTGLQELLVEARFYQIDQLINDIENRLNETRANPTAQTGVRITLVSDPNDHGRILRIVGSLELLGCFDLSPITTKFLRIITAFTDLRHIACQLTFPLDDHLISCQIFDPLQRFVLAKQARTMNLTVSYCDDFVYVPIERHTAFRDDLIGVLLDKHHGQLLHTNLTNELPSSLIEHWLLPTASDMTRVQ